MEAYLTSPPIDWEDESDEQSVTAAADLNGVGTEIYLFTTKMGKSFSLSGFGQAWDAAMDGALLYSLLLDGISHPKYHRREVQITPPEQVGYSPIPVPISVGQGVRVSVRVNTTVTGNFAARVKGEYRDL